MPCYHPTRVIEEYGRPRFDLDPRYAAEFNQRLMNIPCRDCIGCNAATAREWSVRAFHEAQMHTEHWQDLDTRITTEIPSSSVITLTFDDEHLPADGLLDHSYFQRFMKRLRIHRIRSHEYIGLAAAAKPIRYFQCGEYGGKTQRPHFHAIIFGESFSDRYSEQSLDGQVCQMSYILDELWSEPAFKGAPPTKIGRATVDTFSFAGAGYVAGYIAKASSTGGLQGPIAEIVDKNGVVRYEPLAPEYRRMSTKPGLGASWLLKPENLDRIYSSDTIQISVWRFHPPKYYDTLLRRHRPDLLEEVQKRRREASNDYAVEWSPKRCSSAEKVALSQLQQRRDSL